MALQRQDEVRALLRAIDEGHVRRIHRAHPVRGVRAVAPKAHVPVDQARRELLERRVNKDEQVDEAAHIRPAGQLETQVVALRDDDAVDLDGQGGGDGSCRSRR